MKKRNLFTICWVFLLCILSTSNVYADVPMETYKLEYVTKLIPLGYGWTTYQQWEWTTYNGNWKETQGERVALMVHGFGFGSHEDLRPLAEHLITAGYYDEIYAVEWHEGYGANGIGAKLALYIQTKVFDGIGKIDIFAHSMGGLIAREAIERPGLVSQKVNLLVTMGTPHNGISYIQDVKNKLAAEAIINRDLIIAAILLKLKSYPEINELNKGSFYFQGLNSPDHTDCIYRAIVSADANVPGLYLGGILYPFMDGRHDGLVEANSSGYALSGECKNYASIWLPVNHGAVMQPQHNSKIIDDWLNEIYPVSVNLSASRTNITQGESITLNWSSSNAQSVSYSNFGVSGLSGQITVTPSSSFVYFIGVSGASGNKNAQVSVIVNDVPVTPPPPTGTVSTPTFSPDGGNYSSIQDVRINCATSGATIRYTLNGTDPTTSSASISNGSTIHIGQNYTLKAKAWKSGMNDSGVKSAGYTVALPPPDLHTGDWAITHDCVNNGEAKLMIKNAPSLYATTVGHLGDGVILHVLEEYVQDPVDGWYWIHHDQGGWSHYRGTYQGVDYPSYMTKLDRANVWWTSTPPSDRWYRSNERLVYTWDGYQSSAGENPAVGGLGEIYLNEAGLGWHDYWGRAGNMYGDVYCHWSGGWDDQAPSINWTGDSVAQRTWYRSSQTIRWSSSDSHSGIKVNRYSWTGSGWTDGSLASIPEGKNLLVVYAEDNAWAGGMQSGNSSTISGEFWLDTGSPILTINGSQTSQWFTTTQTVNWVSADSISGVNTITLSWDGGTPQTISGSGTIDIPEGKHTCTIIVTDNAGNVTTKSIGPFWLDTGVPTLEITGPETSKWFNTAQNISWTSGDATSGVGSVTISWDGGTPQAISASGTIAIPEGKHVATITVTDVAGNVTTKSTGEYWIDSTPPQVSASLTTSPTGDNEWYLLPASLYMDATDTLSGIATLQYRIDGGEWITYNPSNTLTGDGKHIIECRATDVAGNVSAIVTLVYNLDTTPPGIPVVTVSPESASTSILSASWYSTEPHSGIAEYDFAIGTSQGGTDVIARRMNDNRPYAYVMNLNLAIGGKYYFTVWAKNGAGIWAIDAGFSTAITVVNGNSLDGPGGLFSAGGTGDIPQQDIRSTGGKSLVDKMGSFVVFNSLSENFEILHGVDERLDGDYSAPTPVGEQGFNRIRTSANYAICDVLGLFVVGSSTNGTATIQHGYFAPLGGLAGVTLTADTASPVDKGKTVRFIATVSGGTILEYQFVVVTYPGGVATYPNPMPAFQSSNTFDWTPIAEGKHNIIVYTREKGTTFPVQYANSIYDVKTVLSGVVLTSNLASPITVGKSITFTATAIGGAVVEYQFKEGDTVLRDFSADKTYQVTGEVGTHTITVFARDIHGVDPVATVTFSKTFTVNSTLSAVALTTNPANAVLFGRSITLIATPTGGSNLQYKFMYGTLVLRDFASSNSYVWTPSTLKTYTNLTVVAKDTGGIDPSATVISPAIAISTKNTPTAVSLTSNPANVALFGTPITFTATTVGGVNPQYKFMYGTIMLRDFASSNTLVWTPGAVKAYSDITVVVKDAGGVDPLATFTSPPISITTKLALTAITLATSPVNTVLLGNSVTLTATATGGVNLQYKFMYSSTTLRDFAAGNILVWKPGALKTYIGITVVVKDLGGANPALTMTSDAVSITTKAALTGISMTTSPLNAVLLGKPVTLTATAIGGVNLQYKFMYGTLILRDFAASNSTVWTPGALKIYNALTVVVKDLGGVNPALTLTSSSISITTKAALTGITLATAPVNACTVGTPVTLTATTTGGAAVMYKFMTGTTIIRDFNSSNTCTWTPNTVQIHSLTVIAKDTGGIDPLATITSPAKTFTVTGPLAPLTAVSVAALPTTVTVGNQVTLTATVTGGATVQYKFMYGLLTLRDFAVSNSYTFTPSTAKTYSGIIVTAKDTGGVNPLATVVSPAISFVVVK